MADDREDEVLSPTRGSNTTGQKAVLLEKLDLIRFAELQFQEPGRLQDTSSCSEVLISFESSFVDCKDDASLKDELVELGMPQMVMNAAQQHLRDIPACKAAIRILSYLISSQYGNDDDDAQTRAIELLKQGAFSFVTQISRTIFHCRQTMGLCFVLMLQLFQQLPERDTLSLGGRAVEDIIRVAVFHGSSATIYVLSCKLFALLLQHSGNPRSVQMGPQQAVSQYVFEGIRQHKLDGDCQQHGRALLRYLVGPETALLMVNQAYSHHYAGVGYSCAA